MDTEQEEMQFMGLYGVYRESYKIIFAWSKVFNKITLTLILPLSFIFLIHIEVSNILFGKILHNTQQMMETPQDTPQYHNLTNMLSSEWAIFILFKLLYFTFLLVFSLLSTSAAVYTVASIYTSREVTFSKVMNVVPKVWKRLMVTFLCTFVAFFAYNVMTLVVFVIWALAIGLRNGGVVRRCGCVGDVVFRGVCVLNGGLATGECGDRVGGRHVRGKSNDEDQRVDKRENRVDRTHILEARDFFWVDTVSVQENGGTRVEVGVCG